jgi:hypothetical protein
MVGDGVKEEVTVCVDVGVDVGWGVCVNVGVGVVVALGMRVSVAVELCVMVGVAVVRRAIPLKPSQLPREAILHTTPPISRTPPASRTETIARPGGEKKPRCFDIPMALSIRITSPIIR